jgi:sirohydrochlorin cobaltochelatase
MTKQLILIAHGSRDPRWKAPFEDLIHQLQSELGPEAVQLAYLEMTEPALKDVAERAVVRGVTHLSLLPLFMAAGVHVATDIPHQAQELMDRHPDLHVEILPAVGENPKVINAMAQIVFEWYQKPAGSIGEVLKKG